MNGLPGSWPLAAVVFAVIAAVSLVSALSVVTRREPVSAIAWLVVHFVATACAYILLASQFIAAVQVLVYAGAIMVLFLFVIMLLGVDKTADAGSASGLGRKVLVVALGLVLLTLFGKVAGSPGQPGMTVAAGSEAVAPAVEDSVEWIAANLFSKHLVSFELSSLILIIAMAGVLVYSTRRGPAKATGVADAATAGTGGAR